MVIHLGNVVDLVIYGIKLNHNAEFFYWYDSITYNEYSAYINFDLKKKGDITIKNDSISENLKRQLIDDYDKAEEEIKFMEL